MASRPLSRTTASEGLVDSSALRILSMSLRRVEIRMYRRSRTSSDVRATPAHFEFVVRCDWNRPSSPRGDRTATRRDSFPTVDGERMPTSGRSGGKAAAAASWSGSLPSSYLIRRKWNDLAKFHNTLANELAFDPETGTRRVKTAVPKLPEPGQLQEFLLGVAATGDCTALYRLSKRREGQDPALMRSKGGGPWDELDMMHTIYAENRLGPYFQEVSKILREVPPSAVEASAALKNFVTWGICNCEDSDPEKVRRRFLGPCPPVLPDPEDVQRVARLLRQKLAPQVNSTNEESQRPASTTAGGFRPLPLADRAATTATLGQPSQMESPSKSAAGRAIEARSPMSASAPELRRTLPSLTSPKTGASRKPPPRRCYFLRTTAGFRIGGEASRPFAY